MPTYTVTTANIALSPEEKSRIASAITAAHNTHTGAPSYFAQVIFAAIAAGDHFIGGQRNTTPQVYIHGLIRAGRTDETKRTLMAQILRKARQIAGVGAEDVWVYIQDIAAGQMIEFGRFLPLPGAEAEWRKAITAQKLADLTRAGVAV
ncbi:MAG: tautomerase family protein [Xanthobacteraceae bacterium]|jgi:phenylpyruvate tautomerase PptA (4-oxalocrotonate tautomerase family)